MKIKSRDQFWNDFAVWSVLNSRMILDFTSLVNFWSVVVKILNLCIGQIADTEFENWHFKMDQKEERDF